MIPASPVRLLPPLAASSAAIAAASASLLLGADIPVVCLTAGGAVLYGVFIRICEIDRSRSADYLQTGEASLAVLSLYLLREVYGIRPVGSLLVTAAVTVITAGFIRLFADRGRDGGQAIGILVNAITLLSLGYLFLIDAAFSPPALLDILCGPLRRGETLPAAATAAAASGAALAAGSFLLSDEGRLYSQGGRLFSRTAVPQWPVAVILLLIRGLLVTAVIATIGVLGCAGLYLKGLLPGRGAAVSSSGAVTFFLFIVLIAGRLGAAAEWASVVFCVLLSYLLYGLYRGSRKDYYDRM
ncbi:MAG: hypothetical protein JXA20_07615 [Spirochaetes bacterium]|nr:hypothetical protein [Spirochaetota bacterium]